MADSRHIHSLVVDNRKYFLGRATICKTELMQNGAVVGSAGQCTAELWLNTPNWAQLISKDSLDKYVVTLFLNGAD